MAGFLGATWSSMASLTCLALGLDCWQEWQGWVTGPHISSSTVWLYSHTEGSSFLGPARESKLKCTDVAQAPAYVSFSIIPLVKGDFLQPCPDSEYTEAQIQRMWTNCELLLSSLQYLTLFLTHHGHSEIPVE